MKQSVLYVLLLGAFLSLVFSPGCSTTEEQAIVYDITGNWVFTCVWNVGPAETLSFSFTGANNNGLANNITKGYSGIYTVNNTAVEIITNHSHSTCGTITNTYSGTFTSPTTMSGSHQMISSSSCWVANIIISWTAIKL